MVKFTKYKWRFYADNNIAREMVGHLRNSNMDVLWIAEVPELRRRRDDTFHYRKATKLRRYLLTNDMDFWDDRKFPVKDSPGVVVLATNDSNEIQQHILQNRAQDRLPISGGHTKVDDYFQLYP